MNKHNIKVCVVKPIPVYFGGARFEIPVGHGAELVSDPTCPPTKLAVGFSIGIIHVDPGFVKLVLSNKINDLRKA